MAINFIKKNWLILLIILLAFVLRLWGSWYGLPGLFIGDEKSLVGGALKMIYQQNPFPIFESGVFRILYYPVLIPWIFLIFFVPYLLFIYLTGDFSSLAQVRDYFIMDPSVYFLIGRIINVLFATATVYLLYLLAKKIFSHRAGLITACLYAVSFLPVHQGHFVKHWNIAMFFALLSAYYAFSILKNNSKKKYVLSGLWAGLACVSNYLSVLYGIILVLVHFLFGVSSFKQKVLDKKLWLFIVVVLLFFGLAILAYPQDFIRIAFGEDSTTSSVKSLAGFMSVSWEIIKSLWYLATFMLIPALLGYLILLFKNRKLFLALIIIPLFSFFLYYFLYHFEGRYVLFFLPILAIMAGFGLDQLFNAFKIKSNLIISLIILAIMFLPLKNAIVYNMMIVQEDTRNLAKQWVEENIPIGSRIIVNSWEFNLIKDPVCIEEQRMTDNMSLRSRDYIMFNSNFPNSYCVWQLDLAEVLPDNIKEYQYYLVDSFTGRRFGYLGEGLIEKGELIKSFEGSLYSPAEETATMFVHDRLKQAKLGPTVDIYQLK